MTHSRDFVAGDIVEKYADTRIRYDDTIPKAIVEFMIQNNREQNKEKPCFDVMLDAGCGFGSPTRLFSSYFHSITGFDISEKMIEKANELNDADNIRYVVGRGENMPAIDESVDLITCTWAIHFMDVNKFVAECIRVLKPDGYAAILGPIVSDILCCTNTTQANVGSTTAIDLWRSYMNSIHAYSKSIDHPQKNAADNHKVVYDKITGMNKTRKTGVTFPCHLTLKQFMACYLCVPCFQMKESEPGLENESMKMFAEKLKNLWNISHLEDQDVKLEVVYSVEIIFLTKKK